MLEKVRRAAEIYQADGLIPLLRASLKFVLRQIRPITPSIKTEYNGVTVERHHLADCLDPDKNIRDRPTYEGTIISEAVGLISQGDTVVILGGGLGVVTVHAARESGPEGDIFVYEGAKEMLSLHSRTLALNPVTASVTVTHAIVGSPDNLWGSPEGATVIEPEDLPMPDVCIVDIEGEEIDVVPSLPDAKTMIVETHGVFESPTDSIIEILRDRGYEVHDAGVAEPEMARQHAKDDVKVVIATKKERPNNIQ